MPAKREAMLYQAKRMPRTDSTMHNSLHLYYFDDLSREQSIPGPGRRLFRVCSYPLRQRIIHHAVEEAALRPDHKQAGGHNSVNLLASAVT